MATCENLSVFMAQDDKLFCVYLVVKIERRRSNRLTKNSAVQESISN